MKIQKKNYLINLKVERIWLKIFSDFFSSLVLSKKEPRTADIKGIVAMA